MKNDYSELDAAILKTIAEAARPLRFDSVFADAAVYRAAHSLSQTEEARFSGKPAYRFVDARLQAARKAGKIRHTSKGWETA